MTSREKQLHQIKNQVLWDFVVIGGGASGLGTAVDAASRGYQTVLFESVDFGKGTSSRSTKLVHGGIRYLAQGKYRLVKQALEERGFLAKNAKHLFKNQQFVIPHYKWWQGVYYMLGLSIYNLLAGSLVIGKIKKLNRNSTIDKLPNLIRKKLLGGIVYHDGLFDDSRLAVNLAQTAIESGATVLNHMTVIDLIKNEEGKLLGVVVKDNETNETYKIHAKVVINATGVFTNNIIQLNKEKEPLKIVPSQGVHLVLDAKFLKSNEALMIPKTTDGRVLFMIPWHQKLLVGTTDTPIKKVSYEPKALEEEVTFILDTAHSYLSEKPKREDVLSVFAGLRPLVASNANKKHTKEISRGHKIIESKSGLISIIGGKWTTYRRMSEELVNKALKIHKLDFKPCITKQLSIHGNINKESDIDSYLYMYGSDSSKVIDIINEKTIFSQKIHPNYEYKIGEVVWCVRHEMARTVEDILARRIRLLFLDARAAIASASKVANIMADELNKEADWVEQQEKEFIKLAKNYLLSTT